MRNFALLVVVVCGLGTSARAEDVPNLENDGILLESGNPPRIALQNSRVLVSPKSRADVLGVPINETYTLSGQMPIRWVDAMAADKKAYWTMTDLVDFGLGCGSPPCPPQPPPSPANAHASFLWQKGAKEWELIAWDVAPVVSGKDQAVGIKKGKQPSPIKKGIDAGAEDVVKLFEASIGDPKAFAATVSARKDVVLYGNEAAERTVSGAKVKAKLEAWNLGFKVRDGIQAGVTVSKTVAWVAANVDSTSAKKPKDKPVPYRVFAIYEKTGADWKLVHANFAYIP